MPSHCPLTPRHLKFIEKVGWVISQGPNKKKLKKSLKYCIFCLHVAQLDKRCTQRLSRDVIFLARLSKQRFTVREIHCLRHVKAAPEEYNPQQWLRWVSNGPQDCSLNIPLSKETTTCRTQLQLPRYVNKVSLQVCCYGLFFYHALNVWKGGIFRKLRSPRLTFSKGGQWLGIVRYLIWSQKHSIRLWCCSTSQALNISS